MSPSTYATVPVAGRLTKEMSRWWCSTMAGLTPATACLALCLFTTQSYEKCLNDRFVTLASMHCLYRLVAHC